eukprot:COSAG01_NODE_15624_length_1318_cov_1.572600_3_plen_98_part_01
MTTMFRRWYSFSAEWNAQCSCAGGNTGLRPRARRKAGLAGQALDTQRTAVHGAMHAMPAPVPAPRRRRRRRRAYPDDEGVADAHHHGALGAHAVHVVH